MSVYLKCKADGGKFSFEGKTTVEKPYLAMNYTTQTGSESSQTTMSKAYIPLSTNSEFAGNKKIILNITTQTGNESSQTANKPYYVIGAETTTVVSHVTRYSRTSTSESTNSNIGNLSGFMISISGIKRTHVYTNNTLYSNTLTYITESLSANRSFSVLTYIREWTSKSPGITNTSISQSFSNNGNWISNPNINYIALCDNLSSISKFYTISKYDIEENITYDKYSLNATMTGITKFMLDEKYVCTRTYTITASTSAASYSSYEEDITITTTTQK